MQNRDCVNKKNNTIPAPLGVYPARTRERSLASSAARFLLGLTQCPILRQLQWATTPLGIVDGPLPHAPGDPAAGQTAGPPVPE